MPLENPYCKAPIITPYLPTYKAHSLRISFILQYRKNYQIKYNRTNYKNGL